MSGLLIFIPKQTGEPAKSQLAALGLDALLPSGGFGWAPMSGPADITGIAIAPTPAHSEGRAARIGFSPDHQAWSEADGGKYWLGFWSAADRRPRPADLERREQVDGHLVALADGADWLVPLARSKWLDGSEIQPTGIPKTLRIGKDGEWLEEIVPRFAAFCENVDRLWTVFQIDNHLIELTEDDVPPAVSGSEKSDLAVEALSINYALNKWAVSALGLLTNQNREAILGALYDQPNIERMIRAILDERKKKPSTGGPESAGDDLNYGESG